MRVTLVHPALRPYRAAVYRTFADRFDARFLLVGFEDVNRRWIEHYGLAGCEVLRERRWPGVRGVAPEILTNAAGGDYDVWVASGLFAWATLAAWPIVKARRKPFVVWTEDWYWPGDALGRAMSPVVRAMVRSADLIVADGSPQERFVRDAGARLVRVVHNATRLLDGPAVARSSSRVRVLSLGRLLEYKGADLLIEAYSQIETDDTELVIAGAGPFEARCRDLASSLRLRHVEFAGRVDPVAVGGLLRSTDVLVHPCRWMPASRVKGEAWGFVINEAMEAGLPVITTKAVGASYDLVDERTGFVLEPGDVIALTETLRTVAGDEQLRRRLGLAARQRAMSPAWDPNVQAEVFAVSVADIIRTRDGRS